MNNLRLYRFLSPNNTLCFALFYFDDTSTHTFCSGLTEEKLRKDLERTAPESKNLIPIDITWKEYQNLM